MHKQAVGAALALVDRVVEASAVEGGQVPTGFGICRPPGHHAVPTVRACWTSCLGFETCLITDLISITVGSVVESASRGFANYLQGCTIQTSV